VSERLAMDSTAATEAGQVSTLGPIAKHWIEGEWTESDTVSESINPATGAVLGEWADGGEAEAAAAIAAARRAFDTSPWSRDRRLRHRSLSEMADRFDAHAQELGTLVTKENGKKLAEGMFESTTAGATLRHAAAQAITDTFASAGTAHSNIRRSGPRASVSAPR
jgi:betaine-aldehyde dehydrogenase